MTTDDTPRQPAAIPEEAAWLALLDSGRRRLAKRIIYAWCLERGRPLATLLADPWNAAQAELGLDGEEAAWLDRTCRSAADYVARVEVLAREGGVLTRDHAAYPDLLTARLPEEELPYCFCYQGDLSGLALPAVAVLGVADAPREAAERARALAEPLAKEELALVSGYERGVERLMLDAWLAAGGMATVVLPMGLRAFRKATGALRNERLLLLSPYAPEAAATPDLAAARLPLVAALAEGLVLLVPDRGPGDWPLVAEALAAGRLVLIQQGEDAALMDAWRRAGAVPFTDAEEALERLLAPADAAEAAAQETGAAGESLLSAEPIRFRDADEAIDALGRTGRVPDALARRLRARQDEWPRDDDAD